jgi:hypothetical protein
LINKLAFGLRGTLVNNLKQTISATKCDQIQRNCFTNLVTLKVATKLKLLLNKLTSELGRQEALQSVTEFKAIILINLVTLTTEASFLNKNLSLVVALGVAKYITIIFCELGHTLLWALSLTTGCLLGDSYPTLINILLLASIFANPNNELKIFARVWRIPALAF